MTLRSAAVVPPTTPFGPTSATAVSTARPEENDVPSEPITLPTTLVLAALALLMMPVWQSTIRNPRIVTSEAEMGKARAEADAVWLPQSTLTTGPPATE